MPNAKALFDATSVLHATCCYTPQGHMARHIAPPARGQDRKLIDATATPKRMPGARQIID
jgi:hypothetical protein